jgi:hypothetical protein
MVSSLFVDALKNPTNSLLDIYDTCNPDDDFPALVSKYFSDVFEKPDAFQEVREAYAQSWIFTENSLVDTSPVC